MFKKIVASLLVLLLFSGFSSFVDAEDYTLFADAKGHWAEDAIHFLYDKKIVKGLPNGKFGVEKKITRGDAAIMIARAKNLELGAEHQNPFKDVSKDNYYYEEVVAASKAGYLNGYPNKTFNPEGNLSREEMAKILVVSYNLENKGGGVFKDVKVKSWSYPFIQTITSNHITKGYKDKTFKPENSITRAEFSLLLARTIDESFRDSGFKIDPSFTTIEEEATYVMENYLPNSHFILQTVAKKEEKRIEELISTWKQDDNLFQTIETAVHEEMHSFQHLADPVFDFGKDQWLLRDTHLVHNEKFIVQHFQDAVFPSEEMSTKIPEELRTLRWGLYVGPGSNVTANVYGPYGLLDEFEAYYQGNIAVYHAYDYLLSLPFESKQWLDYYAALDGTAFYEFKFLTLRYLLYAKEMEPTVYELVMNDKSYKRVFKDIYTKYESFVEELKPAREKEMIEDLTKLGVTAKFENHFLYIGNKGRGNTRTNIEAIKKEMTQEKYEIILKELLN